jgi:hypothetical protein
MDPYLPMSDDDRHAFQKDGFLIVPNALGEHLRARMETAVDRAYERIDLRGGLSADRSLHLLGAVHLDPLLAPLLDAPAVFPYLWGHLGWNIHVHHSHIDVNPPTAEVARPAWRWHQDGYRQNADLDLEPRPMLSMKVGYVLSDLSQPGRGGTLVIPGSHLSNTLDRPQPGPDGEFPLPHGAVEIVADPGDAFIFDRRLWHAQSHNRSAITRKMIFVGYTYRWIRPLDAVRADLDSDRWSGLTPIRRQLLGEGTSSTSFWGPTLTRDGWEFDSPLRAELLVRGLLDHSRQYLR